MKKIKKYYFKNSCKMIIILHYIYLHHMEYETVVLNYIEETFLLLHVMYFHLINQNLYNIIRFMNI